MKKTNGFTLIEVIISFSIIVLISSFFFYFFKAGINSIKLADEYFNALNLGQQKMEEIRASSAEAISNLSFANNKGSIKATNITSNLFEISLTYNWHDKKNPIELYTLRAK